MRPELRVLKKQALRLDSRVGQSTLGCLQRHFSCTWAFMLRMVG